MDSLNYSLSKEARQEAFEEQNLAIQDYEPVSLMQFQQIEYEAFYLSQNQIPYVNEYFLRDFNLLF